MLRKKTHMDIFYDHQVFSYQECGGITRYFSELFKTFKNSSIVNIDLGTVLSDNIYLKNNPDFIIRNTPDFLPLKVKHGLNYFINSRVSRKKIKDGNHDLFHPTYYDPYFLPILGETPYVITVYDMTSEMNPDLFYRDVKWKKKTIHKASGIIAISEYTKSDLVNRYHLDPDNIEVIYLGNSLKKPFSKPKFLLPESYLLYVGYRGGYKNFERLVKAISTLLNQISDLHLICVGGSNFDSYELNLLSSLNILKKVHQVSVSDSELGYLYANAKMFVFPSLYEGFGLPILEAFGCDCPVVLSNQSCLPEIAGDGGYYFDPFSVESIEEAIKNVYFDESVQKKLVTNGREVAKKFSWEKTGEKTKNFYESIVKC